MDETEQRVKLQQTLKETTDFKLDTLRKNLEEDIKSNRTETRVLISLSKKNIKSFAVKKLF